MIIAKRFAYFGFVLLLLNLLLAACGTSSKPAVNFTLTDTQGKKTVLYDFKGKPVLLAFITTW
jgi:cytochrome oxidase Cu insertion factor (SCO1/SenC/PrrC family)